jgi:hypothetical protein
MVLAHSVAALLIGLTSASLLTVTERAEAASLTKIAYQAPRRNTYPATAVTARLPTDALTEVGGCNHSDAAAANAATQSTSEMVGQFTVAAARAATVASRVEPTVAPTVAPTGAPTHCAYGGATMESTVAPTDDDDDASRTRFA